MDWIWTREDNIEPQSAKEFIFFTPSLAVTLDLRFEAERKSQGGTHLERLLRSICHFCQTKPATTEITEDDMRGLWWSCNDISSEATNANDAKLDMFASKQRSYDAIPPTETAIKEDVTGYSQPFGNTLSI